MSEREENELYALQSAKKSLSPFQESLQRFRHDKRAMTSRSAFCHPADLDFQHQRE